MPSPTDTAATGAPRPEHPSTDQSHDDERRSITGRAGIVAGGTLVSRVLGLVREQVLAGMFSRATTDVFMVAFVIPNVLRQLLAEGAVQNAVLPVLSQTKEVEGEAAAKDFFRAARGLSLMILFVVTVIGVFAAPWLVDLFASGYRAEPGQYERTVWLTRWVFPYIFFMGTFALSVAALNANHRFTAAALAPALLNISFIVCGLGLPGLMVARGHDPAFALAIGVLAGGLLQVVALWPSLKAIGYAAMPRLDLNNAAVRQALSRMVPVLFGVGVYAIDVVIARHLLSTLGVGAQSYFGFALRLCDFPQGIFVMAIQAATLPSLARLAAAKQTDELASTFSFGFRLSLFVGIGGTALFVGLAEPVVALIFERGQFSAHDTVQTAHALMALGASVWIVAGVRQVVAVYYAVGDTRTPVIVSAIDLMVFIIMALILKGPMGHVGVALAVTLASAAQLAMLLFGLRRHLTTLHLLEIGQSTLRTFIAAGLAVFAARWLYVVWPLHGTVLVGLGCVGLFAVVFLLVAGLLKSEELSAIVSPLLRRFRRAG